MQYKAKDIAKMLDMSTATISIVLNNKPGVSEQTRNIVLNKIKELECEYLLKVPAVQSTVEKQGSIGFIVYKRMGVIIEEAPFFKYSLESITSTLQKSNYDLKFIYMSKDTPDKEKLQTLANSNCDGFIIYAVEMQEDDLEVFINASYPFVLLDNSFQTRDVDCVAINNFQGTKKAIEYLYQMGHRDIGYIKSKLSITSFTERYSEYKHQLDHYKITLNPIHVIEVGYSEEEVKQAIDDYLTLHTPAKAFITDNDLLACHALHSFKQHGLSIPDDISIIGFDDRPICTLVDPSLTTINVPLTLFGPSAVKLLISKIKSPRHQSLKIDIGTMLVKRNSVRKIER